MTFIDVNKTDSTRRSDCCRFLRRDACQAVRTQPLDCVQTVLLIFSWKKVSFHNFSWVFCSFERDKWLETWRCSIWNNSPMCAVCAWSRIRKKYTRYTTALRRFQCRSKRSWRKLSFGPPRWVRPRGINPFNNYWNSLISNCFQDKSQSLPKFVCDTCLTKLTEFAVYRNSLILTFKFTEALVDLKQSNPKPITALFSDSKSELDVLFRELSLCTKPDPQVEDLLLEFESKNLVECDVFVKVEPEHHSESEAEDGRDDPDYDCPNDPDSDVETKPIVKPRKKSSSKLEPDESSSDDEPLQKKKAKLKKTRTASASSPTKSSGPKKVGRPRIHPEGRHLTEPWSCDKCKFVTKYRVAVERHKKVHERRENRTYPCSVCGQEFKTNDEMRSHSLVHPENQVVCEICGASLRSSTSLKSHMERHEDKRKHSCPYCEYAAYTKLNLKAHMQIHTFDNEKQQCGICGSTFRK